MKRLTNTEFDNAYNKAAKAFGKKNLAEATAELYGMRKEQSTVNAERLWLYMYALNTWDNDLGEDNYLTERQMVKLINKVQQYS